ncbi:hypothetical protein ISS40_00755 [Candidatus Bathyarchaeota archaeon]|nr:hypothetical protein [Candidatus Bathyarchaeota archaeon]
MAQERAPNLNIPASGTLEIIRGRIRETLVKIIPPDNIDIEEDKNEIWNELSIVYFKYDNEIWRQAFRKVMIELYEKIGEVKWDEIYNKIYREEKT